MFEGFTVLAIVELLEAHAIPILGAWLGSELMGVSKKTKYNGIFHLGFGLIKAVGKEISVPAAPDPLEIADKQSCRVESEPQKVQGSVISTAAKAVVTKAVANTVANTIESGATRVKKTPTKTTRKRTSRPAVRSSTKTSSPRSARSRTK